MAGGADRRGARLSDVLVVIALCALSAAPYLTHLGFYSDDWAQVAQAVTAPEHSLGGLLRIMDSPDAASRPVFYAGVAVLFWSWGANPLALHLVNTAFLACAGVFLYLVFERLSVGRRYAVAVAATYLMLPHYATTRFWLSASALNVSLALCLAGAYAALCSQQARTAGRRVSWSLVWAVLIAASLLVYETALPLVLLVPLALQFAPRRTFYEMPRLGLWWSCGVTAMAVVPVLLWKVTHSPRFHDISLLDRVDWFAEFMGGQALISFGSFGIGLPVVAWHALVERADWTVISASAIVGLGLCAYLWRIGDRGADPHRWLPPAALGIGAGIALWLAALSLFFVSLGPAPGAGGIGNRLANVAAVGFALLVVAGCGLVARAVASRRWQGLAFCALIGAHAAAGALVIGSLGSYWDDAAREQARVVAAIRHGFPAGLPVGAFIADGVCPYVGPGIVFDSSWDLRSRLAIEYGHWPRGADVVTPNMSPTKDGLVTSLYEGFVGKSYPYGDLHVYDVRTGNLAALSDAASAQAFFAARHAPACPEGREGGGVPVLGLRP